MHLRTARPEARPLRRPPWSDRLWRWWARTRGNQPPIPSWHTTLYFRPLLFFCQSENTTTDPHRITGVNSTVKCSSVAVTHMLNQWGYFSNFSKINEGHSCSNLGSRAGDVAHWHIYTAISTGACRRHHGLPTQALTISCHTSSKDQKVLQHQPWSALWGRASIPAC